ncbi:hypothetical protein AGABI1DRAFT_123820 [Agaricus bisporus var. burnettii JB137-S8]|uniref:Uncharacterized protein n=1 Tax=Agaricus bisporus var. burnettii (strain JB137-S8 / ATCC MYA-4627 / FGSC 10392) TaxID=597362 RepID=K5XJE8_AGABU|nr:uncharacterized protein AGABI1DRAFT_123820 [Agaricus bisporus var. burnettii JB137-S8]EKM83492.1 hypothetical protein AGABI1DRAFT_123820 [Agaricus bisporus var. burnettii JB137-S8]
MPGAPAVESLKAKPVTRRTSIRQSLNLASVSRAFADVINKDKDSKDTDKLSRKTRGSRRLSTQEPHTKPAASRASMGDPRSPSQATIRTATPESRGSTRGRASMSRTPSDEQSPKPEPAGLLPKSGVTTRAAARRAKTQTVAASSLPKYRHKSTVSEQVKPPSPVNVRAGTRRRFSGSSEDGKMDKHKSSIPTTIPSSDKGARPISPLPQRAALKTLDTTPASTPPTPTKTSTGFSSPSRGSPPRPTKTSKTSASASAVSRSSPTSASTRRASCSSSSSATPQTPKASTVKAGLRLKVQDKSQKSSPSPTPTAHHTRSHSMFSGAPAAKMSHISERVNVDEDDDELEDVELLLAPVARISAATPAMPRIQKSRSRKPPTAPPKTPVRTAGQLPERSNMSYLSPVSTVDGGSDHLRLQPGTDSRGFGRSSIMSWEQLASEASKNLGEDELGKMLSDIPAPFSAATSPILSPMLDIPESPSLSAFESPGGYGSISQVLLPDVTPSPAVHRYSLTPSEADTTNSPVVTLLRLQLAQAENMAKERLMQMQAMEQEIHSMKETHTKQIQEENSKHIAHLKATERRGEEKAAYASSLEGQLRQAEVNRERAVEEARRNSEETIRRSCDLKRRREKALLKAKGAAGLSASNWSNVRTLTEVELDVVQGDRAVLSILLMELDRLGQIISS